MKFFTTNLFALLMGTAVLAQPVLNKLNHAPEVGDGSELYYRLDTAGEYDLPAGTNQTWVLSNLVGIGGEDSLAVLMIDTTTAANDGFNLYFVGESDIWRSMDGADSYSMISDSDIVNQGFKFALPETTITTPFPISIAGDVTARLIETPGDSSITEEFNEQKVMEYPFSYDSSFIDTFAGRAEVPNFLDPTGDPILGWYSGVVTVEGDGYGSLTVSGTVYTNVLRVKTLEEGLVELDEEMFGISSVPFIRESYDYYDLSVSKYAVFRHTISYGFSELASGFPGASDFPSQGVIAYSMARPDSLTLSNKSIAENPVTNAAISPNPVGNGLVNMTFDLDHSDDVQVVVLNMLGETVKEVYLGKMSQGYQQLRFEMTESGIYLVQLTTSSGRRNTQKLIVQ